jgi:hypothetical protein
LHELEPDLVHPLLQKDIRQLMAETDDKAIVKKIDQPAF